MLRKNTSSNKPISNQAVSRLRQLGVASFGATALLLLVVYLMGSQITQAQAAPSDEGTIATDVTQGDMVPQLIEAAGRILYVTHDGIGTLCTIGQPCDLQTAADEALDGDEIRVAAGIYNDIQITGPISQILRLDVSVLIQGGYTSTNWTADPDPTINETILDGLTSARVVHIVGPSSPEIRGFSIQNGQATIGGGIYQPDTNSNALVVDNKIYNNNASGAGGQIGGGVFIGGGMILSNNEIYENTAAGRGAGIYVLNHAGGNPAAIEGNKVYSNSTTTPSALGGGIFIGGAGDSTVVNRNEIYENSSNFGGGIGVDFNSAAVIMNNMIHNNLVVGGSASGGGLLTGGDTFIWHNTIALNSAGTTGGGIHVFTGTAEIRNTIVASNTGGVNSGIDVTAGSGTGSFNNIFNNGSNATLTDPIAGNPMFVDLAGNDFHLTGGSPNINAGDDTVPVNDDFDGQGRPFDGGVEVGADEYYDPANICYSRFNNGPIFDNIAEAMALVTQATDVVKVAGLCTGAGSEVVSISETFILQGGYTITNWIDRHFGPTIIDAEGSAGRRGILINGGSPTIDSLHVTGGNLAGTNGAGIYVAAGSGTPVINNVVLYGNTATGSNGALGIATSLDPVLQFNTIADNTGDGVRFESAVGSIHNSIIYDNSGTAIGGGSGHSFNITAQDPLFVNAAGGDYHITIASPAIGAGDPLAGGSAPSEDFEGDSRPRGSTYDIGADEANQYPDLLFLPDFLERDVERGTVYTYTHVLTNSGTTTDSYSLISNNTEGWTATHPPTVNDLPAGQSAVVEVTIDVPLGANAGQVATTTVTATSSLNSNISAAVFERTTAQPVPGVSFTPSYSQSLLPGTIVTYVHTLQNTGDFTDSFRVEVVADPFDWADLLPSDPVTIELASLASTNVEVRIEVPPFAAAGFANTALIEATSVYSPAVSAVVTDTVTAKPTVGTRYVSTAGTDLNNNCTQTSMPCQTVKRGISQASFEGEVRIAPGVYIESNINVNDTISVTGGWTNNYTTQLGPDATVIDANQANRIFIIAPGIGIAPYFGNMTLQNGFSGSVGGAIWVRNAARPTFNSIIFVSNRGTDGGALYLDPNTEVSLEQSRFISNTATRSGGAIFMAGSDLTSYNNLFDANTAQMNGGALYFQSGQVSVEHNTFNENSAVLRGGGVYNNNGNALIFNTILVSNTAGTSGGAIYEAGGSTTSDYNDFWNNSLPQSNVAVGGNSINANPLFADALYRLDPSSPALDIGWPGTAVEVDFEDDPRPIDQGFDLGWDELSGCRAKRGSTIYGSIQAAVEATGPLLIQVSGRCRGVHTISVGGNTISQTVSLMGNMTIQGGWDSEFTARSNLTPSFVDPEGRGRAFYISGTVEVVLEDLRLVGGDATALGGGPLNEDAGGALYNVNSNVVLSKVMVLTSTASLGGAIYNDAGDLTFAYSLEPGPMGLTVARGLIENNTADLGAALYNNSGQMTIDSGEIHDNTANTDGTIYNRAGTLNVVNTALWDNDSAGDGAGVYVEGGTADLQHLTLYSNIAAGNGGGVYAAPAANVTVRNSIFQSNQAVSGSAIAVVAGATVDIDYNYYNAQAAPAVFGAGEGANSINSGTPPGLKDPANGDFHLIGGAPAEDMGDPNTPITQDFDNQLRPSNQSSDIGADEIVGCLARIRRTGEIFGNPQSAIDQAIDGDWVEVYGNCTGVHTIDTGGPLGVISQTVHLTKNVNLSGGWNETFSSQSPMNASILDPLMLGRALYVGSGVTSTIELMHFKSGNGSSPGLDGNGGAVYLDNAQALLQANRIYGSSAVNGGGVYVSNGSVTIEAGNRIYNNNATDGGGIYLAGTATVVNNFIYQNTVTGDGGAYYNSSGNSSVWHNDLILNTANSGGGLFVAGGSPTIRSNIVISNTGIVGAGGAHGSGGSPSLGYNNFFASSGPNFGGTIANGGPGSISQDPLFTDAGVFDYTILDVSPMIDKGDPDLPLLVDFEKDIRPSHQGFDIGADEIGGCFVRNLSSPEDVYGSPQLVIDLALPGDTIQIDGVCFGVNGRMVSGSTVSQTIFISKNLTIDGSWDSPFLSDGISAVLDARMQGRTVYVDESITVTLQSITLVYGDATQSGFVAAGEGGDIYNTGDLLLDNVGVYSGTAVHGGGIYNAANGTLHIQYSNVATNTATSNGAGIYHAGDALIVEKNDFYNNQADVNGGAVYLNSSGSITTAVQNNFLYDNQALNNGGGVYNVNTAAKIWHNTIVDNSSNNGVGGGIYTQIGAGVTIRNNIVDSNSGTGIHATVLPDMGYNNVVGNIGGNYSGAAAPGTGAISQLPDYVDAVNDDYHLLDDSPGLDVGDDNSPILDDYDDHIRPNNGGFDMGADELNSCLIQVVDPAGIGTKVFGVLQFAIDYANQNNFDRINIARGECSGVRQVNGTWQVGYISRTIEFYGSLRRSDFSDPDDYNNPSINTLSTIINAADAGRAIYIEAGAAPYFEHIAFVGGNAVAAGGLNGGAVYNAGTATFFESFMSASQAQNGGGYYGTTTSFLEFKDEKDRAELADTVLSGEQLLTDVFGRDVSIGTSIVADITENEGGGIDTVDFVIYGGNMATNDGGGIYNRGDLFLGGVIIAGNTADNNGGGMYNDGIDFNLESGLFGANIAGGNGGGLYNANVPATIINGVFAFNDAIGEGGGVYNLGDLNMLHNTVRDNRAVGDGGGIRNLDGDLLLNSTIVYSNTTLSGTGGGLNSVGGPSLTYNNFFNNTPDASTIGTGTDAVLKDPQLIGLTTLFWRSPAIDQADPTLLGPPWMITEDHRPVTRPDGGTIHSGIMRSDIGAYEHVKDFSCAASAYGSDVFQMTAVPGETVTYTHNVTNIGYPPPTFPDGFTDTITITLDSTSNGWATLIGGPQVVELGWGESVQVQIRVDVPLGVLAGVQEISVLKCDSLAIPGRSDIVTDITTVETLRAVDIEPDYVDSAVPGDVLTFTHTITNIGNITDTFRFTPNSGPAHANASIVEVSGNPIVSDTVELEPLEWITISLRVEILNDATAGDVAQPGVVVRSVTDPLVFDAVQNTINIGFTSGTRFVAAENSADTTNCTDFQSPCATLQHAVDQALDGDLILLAAGTYTDFVTRTVGLQNVYINKSVTIEGGYTQDDDYAASVPITNAVILDGEGSRRVVYVGPGVTTTVSSLFIQNGLAPSAPPTTTLIVPEQIPVVREASQSVLESAFVANAGGGVFNEGSNLTLSGLWILNNSAEFGGGIYQMDGQLQLNSVVLAGNSNVPGTDGNGGGVYAENGSVVVENATFAENSVDTSSLREESEELGTGTGGGLYQAAGSLAITNSIFYSNSAASFSAFFGPVDTTNDYNLYFNNDPPETNVAIGSNSIFGDPLFVDGFYHIDGASPAVDSGTNDVTLGFDIDRQPRLQGLTVDLGADEYLVLPGIEFVPISQTAVISEGEQHVFTHTLTNTGDFTDTYYLTMDNQNNGGTGWGYMLMPMTITDLLVGESAVVTFVITGGSPGFMDTTVITATSAAVPSFSKSVTDTTFISQTAGVDIEADETGTGLPADTVFYSHTLTNTGDGPDTYSMTLASALPAGWNVTIDPATTGTVLPGASIPFTVVVQIAGDAISGTQYAALIQATSQADPSVSDTLTDTTTVGAVYGLDLIPNNSSTASAGTDVVYDHFILNNSNFTDTVSIDTKSTPNWPITSSAQMVEVGPFGVEPLSITISIPPGTAGMTHTALVTATSSISVGLEVTATDITTVTFTAGVLLEPDNFSLADPGEVVTYMHTLTNTGDIASSYSLSAVSDLGWPITYTMNTPVLAPLATYPVIVTVTVPGGATPGQEDVTTITATSDVDNGVEDSATDTTRIRQIHDLAFFPDNSGFGQEGTVVSYTHTLSNTGNGPDDFDLTISSSNGWGTAVVPVSVTLQPGEATQVVANLTIPGGTAGMVDTMVVTATSTISPAFSASVMDTTTVTAEPGDNGVLLEPNNTASGLAGSLIFYNHVITNTSSQAYTFEIVAQSSNGWFTLPSPTFPMTLTLAPGESAPVEVNMNIPGATPAGTMDTMVVTATAVISPSIFDTAINVTTVLTEQVAGVDIAPDYAQIAMPGDSLVYTHTLTNLGNDFDTFTVTVGSDQGWTVSANQSSVSLFAGQQSEILVTVNVPPGAISGTVDTTTVLATSGFDPAVSDTALDVTTVMTETTGGGGVSITPDNSANGAPGETLQYGHSVNNLGSSTETYNLSVNSSEGWSVFVNPGSIQILGNSSRNVTVTVMIPGTATDGTVDVTTVTATALSDPGITDSATDTTTVVGSGQSILFMPAVFKAEDDTPPPTPIPTATTAPCNLNLPPSGNPNGIDLVVTAVTLVPANPLPGQTTSVRVTIKNQGQTDVNVGNNFYLDFYDNPNPEPPQTLQIGNLAWGVQGSDLGAGESKTFSANYAFTAGSHRLWAQVDTDSTVNEANENNNLYGCKALVVVGGQSVPQETPLPQPTADRPRETPTPNVIRELPAAEVPKATETPIP